MKNKIITVTLNPCIDKTVNINCFETGIVNRTVSSRIDAGGKGINVSRVLADSDIDTLALGITGGIQGEILENILTKENVPYDFTHSKNETRTNLKIYDPITKNTTDINEPGIKTDGETLNSFYEKLISVLPQAQLLILAGSVPPGCDHSVYSAITAIAKEYNVKVILDADGELLSKGIESVPYAIKPNIHELEHLCGQKLICEKDIISSVKSISDKGIDLVVVSLGKNGAIFYTKSKIIKAKSLDVDVKSTVGCGDSMVAAIAYSIAHGYDLESLSRLSIAAGSLTASKEGTNMCKITEALNKSSEVEIQIFNEI